MHARLVGSAKVPTSAVPKIITAAVAGERFVAAT
jgi:hypothetical protein